MLEEVDVPSENEMLVPGCLKDELVGRLRVLIKCEGGYMPL